MLPAYGIARLGGGKVAPVAAQFEAIASTRLPGGELVALGPGAATGARALRRRGEAHRRRQVRRPDRPERPLPAAGAGPNPTREYSGDNVGNLAVVASVRDGASAVEGRSHLVVTVQRWISPPIY